MKEIESTEVFHDRWSMTVIITYKDGTVKHFIGTCDRHFTDGELAFYDSLEAYRKDAARP